jgi:hypothetical protein
MSSISNQFFALPNEIFQFVQKWISEFKFRLVFIQLFPDFRISEITDITSLERVTASSKHTFCICLGLDAPNLTVDSRLKFSSENPNYLIINLSNWTEEGLQESFLSGVTEDSILLKIWQKLVRDLRKSTSTGLWIVNPVMLTKGFSKNARFTQGAYNLAKNGTKLLQGGWNYYVIEEPNFDQ